MLSGSIILILHVPQKGIQENKVSKKKETLQPAENTFEKTGRTARGACDQTSADTVEATAEIPGDDGTAQEKNKRKQVVQGKIKERELSQDWKGWKKDDEDEKGESGKGGG